MGKTYNAHRIFMNRFFPIIAIFSVIAAMTAFAQNSSREGRVVSISGKTVIAEFTSVTFNVGDEVALSRSQKIVDPVTGKVRGELPVTVGKGVIVDIGLNKASLRVDTASGKNVEIDDIVTLTGKEKKITRNEGPRTGEIQEITDESIVTNLGSSDEISPGDIFLIQRTEPVYDTETKEIIGTNAVNVGRYSVKTVNDKSSVAEVIEQNLAPMKSDIVYKESEYLAYLAMMQSDSLKIDRLTNDVESLKHQLKTVKSELDSLKREHASHLNEYEMLKSDIETVIDKLLSGDLKDVKIRLKNDETAHPIQKDELFAVYSKALKDCLDRKYESAIRAFGDFIAKYPDSQLTENCRYWTAQSYFSMKAYPQAIEGFQAVVRDTRFHHKDDDASIMLGITYLMMDQPDKARSEFESFKTNYPNSEFRNKIDYWIGRLPQSS